MSAVLTVQEPSAKYLVNLQPPLVRHFDLIAQAPGGVARLRELILTLAVQGKLVPQDPRDEPASELLQKIRAEKDQLIAEGKIKRDKPLDEIADQEKPFELPDGWIWTSLAAVGIINPRNDAADETVASFVQMSSIPVQFSEAHAEELRPWNAIKSGFTHFAEGDVGVAKITPCFENGKSTVFRNLSNGIGAGTTELHIVRPLGGIDPRYVLLFLKTPTFLKEGEAVMTGSAGQKRLPRSYFENKPFSLPPLIEQSRIVTRVEELMQLCDALEASGQLEAQQHAQLVGTLMGALTQSETSEALADNWQRIATHFDVLLDRPEAVDALEQTILQLAVRGLLVPQDPTDEAARALLQRVTHLKAANSGKKKKLADDELPLPPYTLPTGWVWAQLGELVENMGSGWSPACDEGERSEPTQWAVLRTTAVQVNEFRSREHKVIPSKLSPRPEIEVKDGDILITRAGPMNRVGISCWVDRTPPRLMLSDKIVRFHSVADAMLPAFIVLTLNAGWTKEQIEAAKSGMAASQVNISQADLRSFWVPVCSKAEQSRIVTRVNELRSLCADLRQRLTAGQTKQKLLADALVTA